MSGKGARSTKIKSPTGESFEHAGRAGRVRELEPAPAVATESGGERLVIKEGHVFVCCRPNGDILPTWGGDGIYADDTRFVSHLELKISGHTPVLLSSSAVPGYAMAVAATNPSLDDLESPVAQQTLSLSRFRFVSEKVYERVQVMNFGSTEAQITLEMTLDADFADTFEVRRISTRDMRGESVHPKQKPKGLTFAYLGEDERFRETIVEFTPKPHRIAWNGSAASIYWDLELKVGGSSEVSFTIEASTQGKRTQQASISDALERVQKSHDDWRSEGTAFLSDVATFDRVLSSSTRDLRLLMTQVGTYPVLAAGIPWFVAPFGRDASITSYQMLPFNPGAAAGTLRYLADQQADEDDPLRDAEPGKILHEVRQGELAAAGLIPHTPYYGSVDATPLFLMLAGAYFRWTGDIELLRHLKPALIRALDWMDRFGDLDGDGFIEYRRRSPAGLLNQGWKDSEDSIMHADGSVAEGPVALVEVQAYAYLARVRMAEVFDAMGETGISSDLREKAVELKRAFNEAFWMPDHGTFALGLDGDKRRIESITTNPGHGLYCGIIDEDKAGPLVERLMADDMFCGWGIRTLSASSPAYNPMSYHNGSIWPHDNALIAAGLKRYGFHQQTERIVTALFEAAGLTSEDRLPELYCGFDRVPGLPFVSYPVACSPQAWAAGAPFMLVQAMLGISARAHEGVLTVNHPSLPPWIRRLEIRGMRVGEAKVSLMFQRDRERTSFALLEREGRIRLSVEE